MPLDLDPLAGLGGGHAEARGEFAGESRGRFLERHPVLGTARAGERGHHLAEIELERLGEAGLRRGGVAEQALGAETGLDQGNAVRIAPGEAEIVEGGGIDREEAAGRAIFGGHVGDGGAVGEWQVIEGGAEELDEFADHPFLAQHLGDGEDEIGRRHPLAQPPGEAEADHVGDEHDGGLAEHRRFGLDAAHPPAQHAEPVDHGGVAVGAEQRVGIGERRALRLAGPYHLGEIFEIDLMADAGTGGDDAEIGEGLLAPAQELVALAVALELDGDVLLERIGRAIDIDHHRVVDDEIDRDERIDPGRIATQAPDTIAHRGEIDHRRHAGEVLHQDAGGKERHLAFGVAACEPRGERLGVLAAERLLIGMAEDVLEQDLEGEGEPRDVAELLRRGRQRIVLIGLPLDGEALANAERIFPDLGHGLAPPYKARRVQCPRA